MSGITVRPIRDEDIEEIIRIDRLLTGVEKSGHWRGRLRVYTTQAPDIVEQLSPDLCQVAVSEGRVAGFIVGDVQSWQFGIPRCGRIVAIGVHPDHARRGVGSMLLDALVAYFDKLELPRVQCLVQPEDPLESFFRSARFEPTRWLTLERTLTRGR
jgi:ribosomal protein S18 acetylase RimI-like enzyme